MLRKGNQSNVQEVEKAIELSTSICLSLSIQVRCIVYFPPGNRTDFGILTLSMAYTQYIKPSKTLLERGNCHRQQCV